MKAAIRCRFARGAWRHSIPTFIFALSQVLLLVPARAQEITVKLKEVSVFEQGDEQFLRGQRGVCQEKPCKEVKKYPAFKSEKPIFGSVAFYKAEDETAPGETFYFAVDESKGTGKGYDRFYFDSNHDLDLGNDPALQPIKKAPDRAALTYQNIKQQVLFELLNVGLDCGALGVKTVELLPRLAIMAYDKEDYKDFSFVRTRIHTGTIKVGKEEFLAELGSDYVICGRLDNPGTALILSPKAKPQQKFTWWGGDRLRAMHSIGDKFYTFSATPAGDQLTARTFDGALGTFTIGPGGRKLDKMTVSGSMENKERALVVGGAMEDTWPVEVESCRVPEGDYLPTYFMFQYGRLRVNVSQNYHSEGKPRDRQGRANVHGIQIRKDKPFVFDFSNKPDVMFASPAEGLTLRPGDTLEVKAVLVDPKLDFMVRGLDDTTRTQTKNADGAPLGYQRNLSLDPAVLITRINGEKVAEGVMPFG